MKANKDNQIVKILLWTTSYLLDCLERFIKFISKNAYIQVSIDLIIKEALTLILFHRSH